MGKKPEKQKLWEILAPGLLAAVVFLSIDHLPFFQDWDNKIYGGLLNMEYALRRPPPAIKDIAIVGIDNDTVLNMPSRWPYARSDFAAVIENIKKAGPRAIGIDFAYLGKSNPKDDAALKSSLDDGRLVLATTIDGHGYLDTSYAFSLRAQATYGIITKLQDEDGAIRRGLIYLVSVKKTDNAFLSWEMQLLKIAKGLDTNSIVDKGDEVLFKNTSGEQWDVPVDPVSKSFLIHFRAHTKDFRILSFYKVLKNNFDPSLLKNKIVLIGVLPSLFQDSQNTAFGWMPGVVLNANAFLALYTHDFLDKAPLWSQALLVMFLAGLVSFFMSSMEKLAALAVIVWGVSLFSGLSYLFLTLGLTLDYAPFLFVMVLCPSVFQKLAKKIKKYLA